MPESAMDGTILAKLIAVAAPVCRKAQGQIPRRGPGSPPDFEPWQIAVLICVAVAARRKSKSSQYRYLEQRSVWLIQELGLPRFPVRSTYFERYKKAWVLLDKAVGIEGVRAIGRGVADPRVLAVDKSLMKARGRVLHQKARRSGRHVRGADKEASWGYSKHHGWVYGYGYEIVVCATPKSMVYPLLVSAASGSVHESRTVRDKIGRLPLKARYVVGDGAYDINACAEAFERPADRRIAGRRWVCPVLARAGNPPVGRYVQGGKREQSRRMRERRLKFIKSKQGKRLYARRSGTVEPFNEWFKSKFDLKDSVWHRGLDNNRTQITAAVLVYQLLVRITGTTGPPSGAIQALLDAL